MTYKFSKKSLSKLDGVHPHLVRLCTRALELSQIDFGIVQGLRSVTEQKANVAAGKSQTMRSRHLTGHAVDVGAFVNGQYINGDTPEEYKLYEQISEAFKAASLELRIPIIWGGDWKTLKDGCHFELDRRYYD